MEEIKLLIPDGNKSIISILGKRRSVRSYKDEMISLKDISELLWAICGKNSEWGGRTAPSAGATYPLEIYLMALNVETLEKGLYHYQIEAHALSLFNKGDISRELSSACLNQKMPINAPATVIIAADFGRTVTRYGERGRRYVYMEAGHCGQNLHIAAEFSGFGTVMIGAFKDEDVRKVLGIKEEILYLCPVGRK
ncbi:MAG TPA: SagB/ThcOx family dehydrogenase [bacterium]|nr:SagB/ThcOx family dehydrogenase [bacterium]